MTGVISRSRPIRTRVDDSPEAMVRRAALGTATENVADVHRPEVALLPAHLIGGDESIIFAIKPSLWFIVFDSAAFVLGATVLFLAAPWCAEVIPGVSEAQFLTFLLTALSLRVGIALLRWVSRFYVLTNRRIMRIFGVFKADVFETPLVNIRNTAVVVNFQEALTRLGTIRFALLDPQGAGIEWRNISNPDEIHAKVRKAIERALDCQPHL